MTKPLKVAVLGAGAVGCYYGARLAQGGADVVLIGRASLAARQSVRLQDQDIALKTSDQPQAVAGADVVLFCVKSGDTLASAQQIAPFLSPQTRIVSLQNGISNADILRDALPNQVISGLVYVAVSLNAPGDVAYKGGGRMVLPKSAEDLGHAFKSLGLEVEISATAEQAAWRKFILNCCVNAVSALGQSNYQTMAAQPAAMTLIEGVYAECLSLALASSIDLGADLWPDILAVLANMPLQTSSTAQDLARAKPSEIDYLNGEVVRRAALLGLEVPRNQTLWALVKLAELKHG